MEVKRERRQDHRQIVTIKSEPDLSLHQEVGDTRRLQPSVDGTHGQGRNGGGIGIGVDRIKKELFTDKDYHDCRPPTEVQPSPAIPVPAYRGRSFQCHVCKAEFGSVIQLTRHAKWHRRSRVRKCKSCCKVLRDGACEADLCERCREAEARITPDWDEVKSHDHMVMPTVKKGFADVPGKDTNEKSYHVPEEMFTCDVCEQVFVSSVTLEDHRLKSHKKKDCFRCKVCKKKLSDQTTLDAHVKKKHGVERPFVCNICGKSYYQKYALQEHEAIHSEKPLFKCNICGREFKIRRTYQRHKNNCTEHSHKAHANDSSHACTHCPETFPIRNDLNEHFREQHPNKLHFCKTCGACFTARSSLVVHQRIHSGSKPYKCNVCDKSFSRGHHLKVHQRLHSDETPFPCDQCNRRFKRKDHLKSHQRTHEEGRKWTEKP